MRTDPPSFQFGAPPSRSCMGRTGPQCSRRNPSWPGGGILLLAAFLMIGATPAFSQGGESLPQGFSQALYLQYYHKIFKLIQDRYIFPTDSQKLLEGSRLALQKEKSKNIPPLSSLGEFDNYFIRLVKGDSPQKMEEVLRASIQGLFESLGDPYSSLMDAQSVKDFKREQVSGNFCGLGIQTGWIENSFTVVSVLEESPAWSEGIRPGDRIVSVNGSSFRSYYKALQLLDGPCGASVKLALERGNRTSQHTVTRSPVTLPPVQSRVIAPGLGYLRIAFFGKGTDREAKEALERLMTQKITALLLDLSGNPGGDLEKAMKTAGFLVPGGSTITSTESRRGSKTFRSGTVPLFRGPVFVLVDGGTASAAEVVAAALRESAGARILGARTFGKGIVQSFFSLMGGTAVRLTTARYLTPLGNDIHGKGLAPDLSVQGREGRKDFLTKATGIVVKVLKGKEYHGR